MAFKIPYTFIPGTKAKANEINSNFSSVAEYLTDINTNLITTTEDLNSTKTNLAQTKKLFEENRTKYCVNSCTDSLMTTAELMIYFNSEIEITNHKGITAKVQSLPAINCQGLANGTYNVFIGIDSTNEYFKNTIYKQKNEPVTKKPNDIWLNTSKEPLFAGKWDGTTWVEYNKVPAGSFTIENSTISTVSVFPYNQNGYNVNVLTEKVFTKFSDFTQGLSNNGHVKLPNGLILQWGTHTFTGTHGQSYSTNFPITFPNGVLNCVAYVGQTISTGITQVACPLNLLSNSSFGWQYGTVNGGSYSVVLRYTAIGY